MIHYYKDNGSDFTLVLLHGTGGDEHDLVPLARELSRKANILSLRGRISENGMLRFFRRFGMHTFDLENAKEEAVYITKFIRDTKKKYKLKNLILLGYSNGASMIQALLLEDVKLYYSAVLLQPGLLKEDIIFPIKKTMPVFISVSVNDPYLKASSQKVLRNVLDESFTLSVSEHQNGHGLPESVIHDLKWFLEIHMEPEA